jgi:hypothetical protein
MGLLRKEAEPYILISWVIALLGWILILAGVAALQSSCVTSPESGFALQAGQTSGYLGPQPCSKIYGYTWYITWYAFFLLVLLPVLVIGDKMRKFRAGFLGLLVPLVMLLGDMANTFLFFNDLAFNGETKSRARTVVAGSIIASIGFYCTVIGAGIVDEDQERQEKTDAPTGETYGGRYGDIPEDPTSTYNPTYTQKS